MTALVIPCAMLVVIGSILDEFCVEDDRPGKDPGQAAVENDLGCGRRGEREAVEKRSCCGCCERYAKEQASNEWPASDDSFGAVEHDHKCRNASGEDSAGDGIDDGQWAHFFLNLSMTNSTP